MFMTKIPISIECEDSSISTIMNYSPTLKFLDLHIDENFSWLKHLEILKKQISPLIGNLFKITFEIFKYQYADSDTKTIENIRKQIY